MEDAGADAVAVHGTREQYSEESGPRYHCRRKQAVKVKVIGNGDIFAAQDAVNYVPETGCDAVMVARRAGESFYLPRSVVLRTEACRPSLCREERIHMCLRQARIAVRKKGEALAMKANAGHARII